MFAALAPTRVGRDEFFAVAVLAVVIVRTSGARAWSWKVLAAPRRALHFKKRSILHAMMLAYMAAPLTLRLWLQWWLPALNLPAELERLA